MEDEDKKMNSAKKWPLEYDSDKKEYGCGLCGQAFVPNHTTDDLEVHFKSCRNAEESGLLRNFEQLQMNPMSSEMQKKVEERKTDVMNKVKAETIAETLKTKTEAGEEREMKNTEFDKNISDIKKDLKTEIKSREDSDKVMSTFSDKLNEIKTEVMEKVEAETFKLKTEVEKEREMKNTEFDKNISDIKKDLETEIKSREDSDKVMSTFSDKLNEIKTEVMEKVETETFKLKTEVEKEREMKNTEFDKNISDIKKDLETEIKSREDSDKVLTTFSDKLNKIKTEVMEKVEAETFKLKTEVEKEREMKNTEFDKNILDIKKNLETEIKSREDSNKVLSTFSNNFNVLEKQVTQMGVTQETKLAEMSGRVSGVSDTISTMLHSIILEAKGSSSADVNESGQWKKKAESLQREIQSLKIQLKSEPFSNKQTLQEIKPQLENKRKSTEAEKQLANKKIKTFNQGSSPINQLLFSMSKYNLATHNNFFQPSFTWTIDVNKDMLTPKIFELNSDMFKWNGYPVGARAKLKVMKNDFLWISLCLEDLSKTRSDLKDFQLIPQVFYVLKFKNMRNPIYGSYSQSYLFGCSFKYSLVFDRCLISDLTSKAYDPFDILIYVESSSSAQEAHSCDGTLQWNMENYNRRLQLEKDKLVPFQESNYFYTSPHGYRIQVEMRLNGTERKMLTVRIVFLTGKFDAELPKEFPHSTTVTLVNRKNIFRNIDKTIVNDIKNISYYSFDVCKTEEVAALVENDALLCKVTIKSQKQTI